MNNFYLNYINETSTTIFSDKTILKQRFDVVLHYRLYSCLISEFTKEFRVNGCKNIFKIFICALDGKVRPEAYCRPKIQPKEKPRETVKVGIT